MLWTYESCKCEALKYEYIRDFFKESKVAYEKSRKMNWIKDFIWLKYKNKSIGYWDIYENNKTEALKYKTKLEFRKKSHTAYVHARKNNWLKTYTWFPNTEKNLDFGKIYSVYKYEFNNKVIYIGLTMQPKERHNRHIKSNSDSSVRKYAESLSIPIPKMDILKSEISQKEAQFYEDYYVNYYKNLGYTLLNKGKTGVNKGSVGGFCNKWTKKKCYNEALKYKTLHEFRYGNYGAFKSAYKHKWLKDYNWLKRYYKPTKWTKEKVFEESKKYKSSSEFQRKCYRAAKQARLNGWISQMPWLQIKYKWNYETCYEEAKKYKSKSEFQRSSPSAYSRSRIKGWLKDYNWFKNNMKRSTNND